MKKTTQLQQEDRRGGIYVFASLFMVGVIGFAAFTVDVGMATLTKGQMQNAADSAAHAAALELSRSFGPGGEITVEQAEEIARERAVEMIGRFRTGNLASTDADMIRDVRVGRRSWDNTLETWVEEWNQPPFNMVEVTVRRTKAETSALPMTFAKIIGTESLDLTHRSVAALYPRTGFQLPPNSNKTIDILPIALDLGSWNELLEQHYDGVDHGYDDDYCYQNGEVCSGSDGIIEISMYPDLNSGLAPGNRGTVDFGHAGNSTRDLKRQIVHGLNSYDLSFFPNNEIRFNDSGALYLNGDTGISAGIQSSLQSIIGQVRAIPIFIEVTGNGNNATYTVVKFAGVRIMDVKLSGGPKKRHLTVQPAVFSSPWVLRGNQDIYVDSILTAPVTID